MIGYPAIEPWSEFATLVLAPNPGPMTLEGTNTFVVRRPGSHRVVIVDPGPSDTAHLRRVMSLGEVELILLTHHHSDHSESARRLSAHTGAPVRAVDPALCERADVIRDGEMIIAGGVGLRVLATPGHTADSVCFQVPDDSDSELGVGRAQAGSVLTGDSILGRGSTVIASRDGSLREHLQSLSRLAGIGPAIVLPGHGPKLPSLILAANAALEHRAARLREVAAAVDLLEQAGAPGAVTVEAVADIVYAHVAPEVRRAAEASVAAQLVYLARLTEASGSQRPLRGKS